MLKYGLLLLGSSSVLYLPTQAILKTPTVRKTSKTGPLPPAFVFSSSVDVDHSLRGRFLHVTDMHLDPHFLAGSTPSTYCHRIKSKKKKRAGYYGTPFGKCDAPSTLVNFTLDYLNDHWSSDIDFVIWTGDSARHEDDKLPRTPDEIYDSNRAVVRKMQEVFSSKGIPVIPTLGNNDILPHNVLRPGPNDIIHTFSSIWYKFIPQTSMASFLQGGYFATEVIPDAIAVISLNTMYFYESNAAVRGCLFNDPHDPGNIQFDWLSAQLETFRSRHIQVWLIGMGMYRFKGLLGNDIMPESGHIPPSSNTYYTECYYRYIELSLRFQDTILGHLYGHENVDHFFFLKAEDLLQGSGAESQRYSTPKTLFKTLIREFSDLPDSVNYDDYAVVNVNPSVVPNPYVPSFRVFSYNITGAVRRVDHASEKSRDPERRNRENCKWWRCWHSDPESPSRKNRLWTPLGYAQYYMPKLGKYGKESDPEFELEYVTFPFTEGDATRAVLIRGRGQDDIASYGMEDLTIGSWVGLANRLGRGREKALRKMFREHMYMGGGRRDRMCGKG